LLTVWANVAGRKEKRRKEKRKRGEKKKRRTRERRVNGWVDVCFIMVVFVYYVDRYFPSIQKKPAAPTRIAGTAEV